MGHEKDESGLGVGLALLGDTTDPKISLNAYRILPKDIM